MTLPVLTNTAARRLFLDAHALIEPPTGPASGAALLGLIDRIGFVQVDSINTVERAHHMILFARRQTYQPAALARLLERDRSLWEHWTHDASILPATVFPHWAHRFDRDRTRLVARWQGWQRAGFEAKFDEVLRRVADHGPVTSADVGIGEARGNGGWWDWHPSKAALEYLWRVGALSVTRRDSFRKVYDLTERVLRDEHRSPQMTEAETVDWACTTALDRLAFATSGELAAYWGAISPEDARGWCAAALRDGRVAEVLVQGADGGLRKSFVLPETLTADPPTPGTRLRILSPFDPALRDRNRAERLFGFFYRIEVFVPEPKRQYGYYVFPVLEGDRLIGRVDAKAHRQDQTLRVRAFWPEAGLSLGAGRLAKLDGALHKLAVFAGCDKVEYLPGWQRETR
ncbi:MAG: crosslink repair DNA glycosylase YcaQ family protein [Pseudomonadota bacterium]